MDTLWNNGFQIVLFQGIFLVYDITNEKSFQNTEKWYKYIREVSGHNYEWMIYILHIVYHSLLSRCMGIAEI